MNTIKIYIFNHFKVLSILMFSMMVSMFLLMLRLKITLSFFYLFLVWNLFLAVIPYIISAYLNNKSNLNKYALIVWFCIWLLFLPNAAYIVTDIIHLRLSRPSIIWFDTIMVSAFAISGLFLFYFSIIDMRKVFMKYLNKRKTNILTIGIIFLSSFGIYLGRVLRYNSWEIIQNPIALLNDITNIIKHPNQNEFAWAFTFGFGLFLSLVFWIFKQLFPNSDAKAEETITIKKPPKLKNRWF